MSGQTVSPVTLLIVCALLGFGAWMLAPIRQAPAPDAPRPAAEPQAPPAAPLVGNGYASVTLQRARDSHFYADAQVNGAIVHFMIDTGASSVVLTRGDALRAGIGAGDFTLKGTGAGGEVQLMSTSIGRLALGPLSAANVPAMVAKDGLPISLLGQSYLSRIGTVSISGDTMVLR
ncbi:MAG TPA: TIGR02281 family clan AA aspartic protease [Allosphingosinicella sp.]|nr:TIGR02281 family clan AA aspartic protease [Allosphingosinicella sp.]